MKFDFIEWLAPLFFIVIWILSKVFMRKDEKEHEEAPVSEAPERAGEIRKEIERKIAERQSRQGKESAGSLQSSPTPTVPQGETPPSPAKERPVRGYRTAKPVASSQPTPVVDLQEELTRRMEQLREVRAQSEEIRRSVSPHPLVHVSGSAMRTPQSSFFARGDLRREVRETLTNPSALGKAFIYTEVLGAPVSMRRQNDFLHFWEQ